MPKKGRIRAGKAFQEILATDPETQAAVKRLREFVAIMRLDKQAFRQLVTANHGPEMVGLLHDLFEAKVEFAQAMAEAMADEAHLVPAKQAATVTGILLSHLSKICRPGGPLRYERRGNRLLVNLADLAKYLLARDRLVNLQTLELHDLLYYQSRLSAGGASPELKRVRKEVKRRG